MPQIEADYYLRTIDHIRANAIAHIGVERFRWFCEEFAKLTELQKDAERNDVRLEEHATLGDAEVKERLSAYYQQRIWYLMTLPSGYQAYVHWLEIRHFKSKAWEIEIGTLAQDTIRRV